jgi:hypothetical protein
MSTPNSDAGSTHDASHSAARLADHWHFSTETAFRIPELLDNLRQQLRWADLKILNRILPESATNSKSWPIEFVRRLLTDDREDENIRALHKTEGRPCDLPICYQFTGSYVFEDFRKKSSDFDDEKWNEIEESFARASMFFKEILHDDKSEMPKWQDVKLAIDSAVSESTTARTWEYLQSEIHALWPSGVEMPEHDLERENKFSFLSLLYIIYSRISFVGEAVGTISDYHFSLGKEAVTSGATNVLAYLVESNLTVYPPREENVLRLLANGITELVLQEKTRPPTQCFPEIEARSTKCAHLWKILYGLWGVFNVKPDGLERTYDLVIPVYDLDDKPINPMPNDPDCQIVKGAFLGWLFVRLHAAHKRAQNRSGTEREPTPEESELLRTGLFTLRKDGRIAFEKGQFPELAKEVRRVRHAMNRFSEMYLVGEMEWVLGQDWGDAKTAADFTRGHYHHCDGWIGAAGISPVDIEMAAGEYFLFLREYNSRFMPIAYSEWSASSIEITHILVNVNRTDCLDGTIQPKPVIIPLRKRPETALPDQYADMMDYGAWIAKSVRQIYEPAVLLEARREFGRRKAAADAYDKTTHQLRKLLRYVHPGFEHLDLLRQYFSVTYLSPKNLEQLGGFYSDVGLDVFGNHFIDGSTLKGVIDCSIAYAKRLHPFIVQAHNRRDDTKVCDPEVHVFLAGEDSSIWAHEVLISDALDEKLNPPYDRDTVDRTKSKVFFFCACVALWLNVFEHNAVDEVIDCEIDARNRLLRVRNRAKQTCTIERIVSRSTGTLETLEYYVSRYPDEDVVELIEFPRVSEDGWFKTTIPIPKQIYA